MCAVWPQKSWFCFDWMNLSKSQITLANDTCIYMDLFCNIVIYAHSIWYDAVLCPLSYIYQIVCGCSIQLFRVTYGLFQIVISIFCSVIAANPLTPKLENTHSNKTGDRYKVRFWSEEKSSVDDTHKPTKQSSDTRCTYFDFTAWHISHSTFFSNFGWLTDGVILWWYI